MLKVVLSSILLLLAAQNAHAFAPLQPSSALTRSLNVNQQLHHGHNPHNSKLNAILDPSYLLSSALESSSLSTSAAAALSTVLSTVLSNENISVAFNIATFGPQLLWLLIIFIPNTQITKKIMGSYTPIIAFSLIHLFIVIASATQENGTAPLAEFNLVFDPAGDPQGAMVNMMRYPNFVSEEWSHVLTWDLFVGRWIWLDGLKRGIFTGHSVLFCNLIG